MPSFGPVLEPLQGVVDGFNTVFKTSKPYVAGSTRVWLNGVLTTPSNDEGHIELGNRKILLKTAPETGDTLEVFYWPS